MLWALALHALHGKEGERGEAMPFNPWDGTIKQVQMAQFPPAPLPHTNAHANLVLVRACLYDMAMRPAQACVGFPWGSAASGGSGACA